MLSNKKSIIIHSPDANLNNEDSKEVLCTGDRLTQQFISNFEKSKDLIKWQFWGSYNGIYRTFPGTEFCSPNHDSRLRPWFYILFLNLIFY